MDNSALVRQLLNTVQSLPPIKRRAVFAVVGAAVADAAIRPFHWVYDRPTLEAAVGDNVRSPSEHTFLNTCFTPVP